MARETRRIGIRTAQVRLPAPASFGPALVRTAGQVADRQFEKQADIRTQEAIRDAGKLNFERDVDGFLMAPTVPMTEDGLLAPSIYDREYTQMVSQRYMQQMTLDVSENLNVIAADNPFDPEAFRILAEGYVSKVTELAPDYLKPTVNDTAQIKMVEHFNHIIRVKAERDHREAKGLQIQTIQGHMDDMAGYIDDPELSGAAMLQARAAIEQGDELHFWLDDEKAERLDALDRQYAVASITNMISNLPPGDEVAHVEFAEALNNFAMGEGTFPMVDEFGGIAHVPLDEMPISPAERMAIAEFATGVVRAQFEAFDNTLDSRLMRDMKEFFNWYAPHAMESLTQNTPIDTDRLVREFNKAHLNVIGNGYKSTLRDAILKLMEQNVARTGGAPTAFQKAFIPGWVEWHAQMEAEQERLRGGAPKTDFTEVELRDHWRAAVERIGNIPGGYREQTKGGATEVTPFYTALTGVDMNREYYSDLINDPNHPEWQRLEAVVPQRMGRIGIWDDALRDTIIGRLMNSEGMNQDTLDQTLRLARLFWDQPTFRRNMRDDSALGNDLGDMLHNVFGRNGRISAQDLRKTMERFADPSHSPYQDWADRSPESKAAYMNAAKSMITRSLEANWRSLWTQQGRTSAPEFDWNLFGDNVGDIPPELMRQVEEGLKPFAGQINENSESEFMPFVAHVVRDVMNRNDYGASKIGFSPLRYSNYNDTVIWNPKTWFDLKPEWAVVDRPPENFAVDSHGNRDDELMEFVWKDFQDVLDEMAKLRGEGEVFVAGVNAGLQFDSDLSAAHNNEGIYTPSWRIVIVDRGGVMTEALTMDGLNLGRLLPFNLNHARAEFEKELQRQRERNRETGLTDREEARRIPISP